MFENLKEKRLFERIVDQIKDAILSGDLKPGDKLPSEPELGRMLGVSRSAVREALRILELSGLVSIRKGNQGGCFIQELGGNQKIVDYLSDNWRLGQITLAQLAEARHWLESMVIDIVTHTITDKDINKLRKSIDEAERFYKEGKQREKVHENFNFHILLVRITGNTILVDTLSAILELLSYMLIKIEPSRRITLDTFKAHREILSLIEAGNADGAKSVNNAHIKTVNNRLMRLAKQKNRSEV
ncbi:MAG: HTH-type transcriptional regulator LutR [Syntrophorhabdaceae bacterium PtaU1.Bin034]|nr:MAG: HTH-type transcriptional regulator LutR [Syntrophorhabdaceae bacterium PtaU1.Bin034]